MPIFRHASPQPPETLPKICLNLWYVCDDGGFAYRLSGRAYALTGTDAEKLRFLHVLSATDFYVAKMYSVPARFSVKIGDSETTGLIAPAVIHMEIANVFKEVIDNLEAGLPTQMRSIDGYPQTFKLKISDEPLLVVTAIREDEQGNLTPMSAPNPV